MDFEIIFDKYMEPEWLEDHAHSSIVLAGGSLLDPAVLTIGCANRVATYKLADLNFYDLVHLNKTVKRLLAVDSNHFCRRGAPHR